MPQVKLLFAKQMLSESLRRGTSLPLIQLVEETKARAELPKGQLDSSTKTFGFFFLFVSCFLNVPSLRFFCWISTEVEQRSSSVIQAEPAELHFSGFQLQKDYTKTVVRSNVVFDATKVGLDVNA